MKPLSTSGFSLIGVLVGIGVAAIGLKISLDMFKNQLNANRTLAQLSTWQTLKSDIQVLLTHLDSCRVSFQGLPIDGVEHPLEIKDPSGTVIFRSGQELDGLTLQSIRAKTDSALPGQRLVTLVVEGVRQSPERTSSFEQHFLVVTDASQVVGCVPTVPHSQWVSVHIENYTGSITNSGSSSSDHWTGNPINGTIFSHQNTITSTGIQWWAIACIFGQAGLNYNVPSEILCF